MQRPRRPTNDTKTSVERNGRMISFDARRCYDGSTACMLSMLWILWMRLAPETTRGIPHRVDHTRERENQGHYAKGSVKPSSTSSSNYASWAGANVRRPNKAGGKEDRK